MITLFRVINLWKGYIIDIYYVFGDIMPKVSVIIPSYNRLKELKKCLDSIFKQTFSDIEVIVINDGSTDQTDMYLQSIQDQRLHFIQQKNQGIGKSRNIGIDKASGEYLMFIDSDDYLRNDAIELLYNKATLDNLDIVVCDYYVVEADTIHIKNQITPFETTSLKEYPELLVEINFGPCNKLWRSTLFLEPEKRFPETIKYEDLPLVSMLLLDAKRIGHVKECLNYFVQQQDSETTTMDDRVFDIFKSLDYMIDYYQQEKWAKKYIDYIIINKLTDYTVQQRYQKDKKTRNKFINEAFNYLEVKVYKYRENFYFTKRDRAKAWIEKSKIRTLIYCWFYRRIHY